MDFKTCPMCGFTWENREDFLRDESVAIAGYQVNFKRLASGYFLFNHSCGTTFSIVVDSFADLYDGPVFEERKTGSDECPGYCLRRDNLKPCPAKCECAFVREIIQEVQTW